ncbi:hypothetical protein [Streptomyces anulatus]|uniref:hypothetical protein n=1 Tax=Streptomyces anulatus TaxID=1892 RepID=UPI00371EFB98
MIKTNTVRRALQAGLAAALTLTAVQVAAPASAAPGTTDCVRKRVQENNDAGRYEMVDLCLRTNGVTMTVTLENPKCYISNWAGTHEDACTVVGSWSAERTGTPDWAQGVVGEPERLYLGPGEYHIAAGVQFRFASGQASRHGYLENTLIMATAHRAPRLSATAVSLSDDPFGPTRLTLTNKGGATATRVGLVAAAPGSFGFPSPPPESDDPRCERDRVSLSCGAPWFPVPGGSDLGPLEPGQSTTVDLKTWPRPQMDSDGQYHTGSWSYSYSTADGSSQSGGGGPLPPGTEKKVSTDLVKVTAVSGGLLGTNRYDITNVSAAGGADVPAGTRFIATSSSGANIAPGEYNGYSLSPLTVNGEKKTLLTLTKPLAPQDTLAFSLGKIQVSLLTEFKLSLDDLANQPPATQDVLKATERAHTVNLPAILNNSASLECAAAVAPLISLCTTYNH